MRVLNIFLAAGAVVAQEEESTTIGLDLSDFERGRNKKKQQVSLVFHSFSKVSNSFLKIRSISEMQEMIPKDSKGIQKFRADSESFEFFAKFSK